MSYATLVEADTYFSTQLFSAAWDDSTDEIKTVALTHATTLIDRLSITIPTIVPQDIKDANCEIALALLEGKDPNAEAEGASVKSFKIGPVSQTNRDVDQIHLLRGIPSLSAWRLLMPYMKDDYAIRLHRT